MYNENSFVKTLDKNQIIVYNKDTPRGSRKDDNDDDLVRYGWHDC